MMMMVMVMTSSINSLESVMIAAKSKIPGQDGLLVVGKEGLDWYTNNNSTDLSLHHESNNVEQILTLTLIQPGDAIVFYNHKFDDDNKEPVTAGDDVEIGMREWKSIHSGLAIPEEKWIATNWFRSNSLLGPFGWMYREQLDDALRTNFKFNLIFLFIFFSL